MSTFLDEPSAFTVDEQAKFRAARAIRQQVDADAGLGVAPPTTEDPELATFKRAREISRRREHEKTLASPKAPPVVRIDAGIQASKARGQEAAQAVQGAKQAAALSMAPEDLARRVVQLHTKFAGDPEKTSNALAREGWDKSLITPKFLAAIDNEIGGIQQGVQQMLQAPQPGQQQDHEGVAEQAQMMAQQAMGQVQSLQALKAQLMKEKDGDSLIAKTAPQDIDPTPMERPITESLSSSLQAQQQAMQTQPRGGIVNKPKGEAGAAAGYQQAIRAFVKPADISTPEGFRATSGGSTMGPLPEEGFFEGVGTGAKQGWKEAAPALLGGNRDQAHRMNAGEGVGAWLGRTGASLVGGLVNPEQLPANVLGYITGAKAVQLAEPILGPMAKVAGNKAAAMVEHMVGGVAGMAPISGVQATTQAAQSGKLAEDPLGAAGDIAKATASGAAFGAGLGAVTGAAGKYTPREGPGATVPELLGGRTAAEPATFTPEAASAQSAALEAMRPPGIAFEVPGRLADLTWHLIDTKIDPAMVSRQVHSDLIEQGMAPAEARAVASAAATVHLATEEAIKADPQVRDVLDHSPNPEQARAVLAVISEAEVAGRMTSPAAEAAQQVKAPLAEPGQDSGSVLPPVVSGEVGVHGESLPTTWYRGTREGQDTSAGTFYSASKESADAFGKVGKAEKITPKNPLVFDDKQAAADAMGLNIPDVLASDIAEHARADKAIAEHAAAQGHDAIIYRNGSFDAPEMHLLGPKATAESPSSSSQPKQPWEMTREEYSTDAQQRYSQKFKRPMPLEAVEGTGAAADKRHARLVREAVSEGRAVPPEVLKDYPDLAPKQSGAAAVWDKQYSMWSKRAEKLATDIYVARKAGAKWKGTIEIPEHPTGQTSTKSIHEAAAYLDLIQQDYLPRIAQEIETAKSQPAQNTPDLAPKSEPQPVGDAIASSFMEWAKKADPEALDRAGVVKAADEAPPKPARKPADVEYPEATDAPDRAKAIEEIYAKANDLREQEDKAKAVVKRHRKARLDREEELDADPALAAIVAEKVKGTRGKARESAKSAARHEFYRADEKYQKAYAKETEAEKAVYAIQDRLGKLSEESDALDAGREEAMAAQAAVNEKRFVREISRFTSEQIAAHRAELRTQLDAIEKTDTEATWQYGRRDLSRTSASEFERLDAEASARAKEKAMIERRIKAVDDAQNRRTSLMEKIMERGAKGDILPESYVPGEGLGKSFPEPSGKLPKQSLQMAERQGAELNRLEKQSKSGAEHAIGRAASVEELMAAGTEPPTGYYSTPNAYRGLDKDIRAGISKLKQFVKEVPEFAIDPRFVVTEGGGLRFQDGGRYTFAAPEVLGIKFLTSPKVGESVMIDLATLDGLKVGGEPKWLIADPAEGKTPASAIKAAGVEPEKSPKGGNGSSSAVANPGVPLPPPPGSSLKPSRIGVDAIPGEAKPIKDILVTLKEGVGNVRAGKPAPHSIGTYYPGSSKTVIGFANDLDTAAHEVAHRLDDLHGIVKDWALPKRYNKAGVGIPDRSPFDAELGVGKKNYAKNPIFQQTIRDGYSLVQKRAEGVAEYLRAWMLNPKEAEAQAPQFTAWFKSKVPAEHLDAIRTFGDEVRQWSGSSNTERVLSNVELGTENKGIIQKVKDVFKSEGVGGSFIDKLNAGINDSLAPVWKAVALAKELRGIDELLPSKDPQKRIRLLAGFDRKAMDVMEHGPVDFKGNRRPGMGGVDWLLEPLKSDSRKTLEADFKDTIAFGLSERVVERAGILDKAVADIKKLANEGAQLAQQIQQAQQQAGGPILGSAVDRLQEIKTEINRIKKKVGYDGPTGGIGAWASGKKARMSGFGAGIYNDTATAHAALAELRADPARLARITEAAKRYRQWGDSLLEYMTEAGRISKDQRDAIKESNNYYFAMKRLHDDVDGSLFGSSGGRRIASVKQTIQRFSGSTRTIENPYVSLIEQTYSMMKEADRNAALRTFTDLLRNERNMYQGKPTDFDQIGSRAVAGDPDTVKVFYNGTETSWQFAPAIHKALKNWGINETPHILLRAAQAPIQLGRSLITLSPQFVIRQQIRDPIARAIISDSGSKPWSHLYFVTHPEEFSKTLSEFERSGGGLFGHQVIGREAYYAKMREVMHEAAGETGPIRTILSTPAHAYRGYKRLVELGEESGRLGEYRSAYQTAIDKGMDEYNARMHAAYEARNIQDFAIAGTLTKALNQWIPFTSAAVRGVVRSGEAAVAHTGRTAARMVMYVGALEAMNYAWNAYNGHDEDVRKLNAYRRDLFWNFKLGDSAWLTIPKPYELGVMGSGFSRAMDSARGEPDAFKGFFGSLWRATVPLDEKDLIGPYPDLVEVMSNHSFFTDRPIIPEYERKKPPGQDEAGKWNRPGEDRASGAGKLLGQAMGVDARYLDRLLTGRAGGFGQLAIDATGETPASGLAMRSSGLLMAQRSTDGFYAALADAETQGSAPNASPEDISRMRLLRSYQRSIGSIRKAVQSGGITKDEGDRTIKALVSKALAEAEQSATAAR